MSLGERISGFWCRKNRREEIVMGRSRKKKLTDADINIMVEILIEV